MCVGSVLLGVLQQSFAFQNVLGDKGERTPECLANKLVSEFVVVVGILAFAQCLQDIFGGIVCDATQVNG